MKENKFQSARCKIHEVDVHGSSLENEVDVKAERDLLFFPRTTPSCSNTPADIRDICSVWWWCKL
jgi:hypothetical protein